MMATGFATTSLIRDLGVWATASGVHSAVVVYCSHLVAGATRTYGGTRRVAEWAWGLATFTFWGIYEGYAGWDKIRDTADQRAQDLNEHYQMETTGVQLLVIIGASFLCWL